MAGPETVASKDGKGLSSAPPINILDDSFATIYAALHPVLLLSAFYFTFSSLVEDPVTTLLGGALPLGVLQAIYSALCLPGSNANTSSSSTKSGQRKKGQAKADLPIGFKVVPAILSLVLSVFLGTPLLAIILVLFGAPLTSHQFQTVLCAAHISLLSSLPLIYCYGVDTAKWKDIAALNAPIDEVFGASLGTLVGAWAGAVPIPLDWDREWQKWPVTIVAGAYIGFAVGKVLGGYVLKGSRIRMD